MRYPPAVVMATVAYLGWESGCGVALDQEAEAAQKQEEGNASSQEGEKSGPRLSEKMECDGKGLNKQVRRQVGIKLAEVFADSFGSLSETPSGLLGSGHGELFHLGQIAFYQLKHRFAGGLPIKGVEAKRSEGWGFLKMMISLVTLKKTSWFVRRTA